MQTPPVHRLAADRQVAVPGPRLLGIEARVAADRVPPVVRVPLPLRVSGDVWHGVVVRWVRLQSVNNGVQQGWQPPLCPASSVKISSASA